MSDETPTATAMDTSEPEPSTQADENPPPLSPTPVASPTLTPPQSEEVAVAVEAPPTPPSPPTPPTPKRKITICVKTPKDKQNIEVDEDAGLADIKAIVSGKFGAEPEYLCLIFAGKMLEETDTLKTHNITEGMTIHLIIKAAPKAPEVGPKRPPADISQTPFGLGQIGGLVSLESLGLGSANFMELQNRMQTELLGNPELLRRVLENPLVQSLMDDSENMKTLIQANPQMRDLMARHPEIRTMMNNKDLLRQTAELAKNPSMLQELMRNLDGTNPMEGSTTNYTTLPNIYASLQPGASEVSKKAQASQKPLDTGGVFSNPEMGSLLQQMTENPQMVQNMMNAPYTQAMLQALQADPTMAAAIVNENPLYKSNPQLQQYITSMMPQLVTQLQNPEVLNMMSNPQAVNALLQIQEGLDNLKAHAPNLVTFNNFPPSTSSSLPQDTNFSQFMAGMVQSIGQNDPKLPPEERYKQQMEHLKLMGFQNEENNLKMLTATFGDTNAAVVKLLALNGGKIM